MRELLSNNSLFVGQLYEDKSLTLRASDLIFLLTDLQTVIITQQFTAGADLFLNYIRHYCTHLNVLKCIDSVLCFIIYLDIAPI